MAEWFFTFIHGFLTIILVIGVIYSRTTASSIAILAALLVLLCMIRYFGGCFLTAFERDGVKPTLTEMGLAYSLKNDKAVSGEHFEEIVVSNLLLIHLIGIATRLVFPVELLF